ncbi:MAG TPA: phosphoribosylformylglycinamidine synthase subunit PurS [Nanoarchaeota archaeon]|nr:MAG: Phosphoribosylformylglycinamidine synthase subunit PurS [archaeon GW2011_AR6]MBS3082582.1 phosphoribosylformylglycinamidine synthase subunit PurS [Candidatus Pacearchaeota archaeon]HIH17457.1 phosphoribosylformylglycinamidine synthase subunit PurS [Nanoarchaeota archaeon]HIH33960.1 phosphoribosylformylglycinamidine synthase subunit PurS [Nanoarchaeota archaeon]HIH51749.1 phosphoribosylformylglycinamidine synthase subunit PurS [Nanoarchaeota archaeon]
MVKAKIYIFMRPEYLNGAADSKKEDLIRNGFAEVKDVTQSKYIELELQSSKSRKSLERRVDEMCKGLLANKVYETYRFEIETR